MIKMLGRHRPDFTDRYTVISTIRDYYNFNQFFDYQKSIDILKDQLLELGWSRKNITEMERIAASGTIYEGLIPHRIKEQGDQRTYQDMKFRSN